MGSICSDTFIWSERLGFRWSNSSLFTHMQTKHLEVVCLDSQIQDRSWFMASLATFEAASESKSLKDLQMGDSSASQKDQIFFPEFCICFMQQKSQLEKNRKWRSKMLFFHFVPRVFSSLFFQISPEKHSFLSSPKLSHLIHSSGQPGMSEQQLHNPTKNSKPWHRGHRVWLL